MGLCGCDLKEKLECSNGIYDGKNWHRIRINRSGERQKICRIVGMKIRGNILCSGELGGLCCRWNVYNQNLDMIDEMKHLPGAWIWKKHFTIVLFAVRRRPEVCCLCLITAVKNMSVQPGGVTPIWHRRGCSSEILNLTPKGDQSGRGLSKFWPLKETA